MTCVCGHERHSFEEPTVCTDLNCKCICFIEATPTNIVMSKMNEYVKHFGTVKEQIIWILDNLKYLRNAPNKQFVDFYFQYVKVYTPKFQRPRTPDYETVRRAKQLLVAQDKYRYGPFDPKVTPEKATKQLAVEEFVTQ